MATLSKSSLHAGGSSPKNDEWYVRLVGPGVEKCYTIRQLVDDHDLFLASGPVQKRPVGRGGVTLGRQMRSGISNPSDGLFPCLLVSRQHAQLVLDSQARLWLYDINSRNGTFVRIGQNQKLIELDKGQALRLCSGDTIVLGVKVRGDGQTYDPLALEVQIAHEAPAAFEDRQILTKALDCERSVSVPWLALDQPRLKQSLSATLAAHPALWSDMEPAAEAVRGYGVPLDALYDEDAGTDDEHRSDIASVEPDARDGDAAISEVEDDGSEPDILSSHWTEVDSPADVAAESASAFISDDRLASLDADESGIEGILPPSPQDVIEAFQPPDNSFAPVTTSEEVAHDDGMSPAPAPPELYAREREDTPSAATDEEGIPITPETRVELDPFVTMTTITGKRSRETSLDAPEPEEVKHAKLDLSVAASPSARGRSTLGAVGLLATGAAFGAVSTIGFLASFY